MEECKGNNMHSGNMLYQPSPWPAGSTSCKQVAVISTSGHPIGDAVDPSC